MKNNILHIEDGSVVINIEDTTSNNENAIKDNGSLEDDFPIFIDFDISQTDIREPLIIDDMNAFNSAKLNIIKSQFVTLFRDDIYINLITDNNYYFSINTNKISPNYIKDMLLFNKPKKILFNIKDYSDIVHESSLGFLDFKLLFKMLWNVRVDSCDDVLSYFKASTTLLDSLYLKHYNMINLAKEINIYIEKNKINKYIYLELNTLIKAIVLENKGIPIDFDKYNKYRDNLNKNKEMFLDNKNSPFYNLNFNDSKELLRYMAKNNETDSLSPKILSLNPKILKKEDPELLKAININDAYNNLLKHEFNGNNIVVKYDIYDDYQIDVNFIPNVFYLDYNDNNLIEGIYSELYYKVLAELSRDKNIIQASNSNDFIGYINNNVLKKDLGVYTEMFIKAYCNKMFTTEEIFNYILDNFNTSLNRNDIKIINDLFMDKVPLLMQFFNEFDGSDHKYARFHNKIFNHYACLDIFIKQVCNLIHKTCISYIDSAINEFNMRFKNEDDNKIECVAFYEHGIMLLCTDKAVSVSVDILNRYMSLAYKTYIKSAKYFNITRKIEYN